MNELVWTRTVNADAEVSQPGGSHPQLLAEPGLNLSIHRAPIAPTAYAPLPDQCRNRSGCAALVCFSHAHARRRCPRRRLPRWSNAEHSSSMQMWLHACTESKSALLIYNPKLKMDSVHLALPLYNGASQLSFAAATQPARPQDPHRLQTPVIASSGD